MENQNEKQFLNENKYQKARKGLIFVAILIVAVVTTLSVLFVIKPAVDKLNKAKATIVYTNSEIKAKESVIEAKYKKTMGQEGWIEEQSKKNDETYELTTNNNKAAFEKSEAIGINSFVILVGCVVIFMSLIIGGRILTAAFGRNILAYGAQTVVPVSKEVIEEMAPTIGRAYGTVASEAAPGLSKAFGTIAKETSPDVSKAIGAVVREAVIGYKEGSANSKEEFCKYCGAKIDSDSKFCDKCGKEQ